MVINYPKAEEKGDSRSKGPGTKAKKLAYSPSLFSSFPPPSFLLSNGKTFRQHALKMTDLAC